MEILMITLIVQEKLIQLHTHSVDGRQLYRAQDLIERSPRPEYDLSNYMRSKRLKELQVVLREFHVVSIEGRNGGTYMTRRGILRLASKICEMFEAAVYEAFEALTTGELDKAFGVAWQTARSYGKQARRFCTDAISEFVEYAIQDGSKNARHYYGLITAAVYKELRISPSRDDMDEAILEELAFMEKLVARGLRRRMDARIHYKTIYRAVIGDVHQQVYGL